MAMAKDETESERLAADEKWRNSDSFRLIQRLRKEQAEMKKSKATRVDAMTIIESDDEDDRTTATTTSEQEEEKAMRPDGATTHPLADYFSHIRSMFFSLSLSSSLFL
jgi:hypothetical protein